jgi:hypothetical protein
VNYASLSLEYDRGATGFHRGYSTLLGGKSFGGVYVFVSVWRFKVALETS